METYKPATPAMGEDFEEFLQGNIIIPRDLLASCCFSDSRSASFIGGSLAEGLGNRFSDLDIYSIGESLPRLSDFAEKATHRLLSPDRRILRPDDSPDAQVFLAHYAVGETRMKIDVEFQTLDSVLALAGRVRELHAYAASNLVLLTRRLTTREEDFVTRLLNGRTFSGHDLVDELRRAFDRDRVLYLAYRWLASDFAIMLDLIGAWSSGDLDHMRDIARENLVRQMQAYLHLRGMTNLRRKWLLKFVDRLLADQPDVADRFRALFFFDAGHDDARHYVLATLDFIDTLFERSRGLIVDNGSAPVGDEAIALLARDRDLSNTNYADLEFEYRAKVYGRPGRPSRDFLEVGL